MLAVLIRVVASVISISFFRTSRSLGAARAILPSLCFSFLVTRPLRSSRAAFTGSKSTSTKPFVQFNKLNTANQGDQRLTSISRNFRDPLLLLLFVLPIPAPPINPLLLLLVPFTPIAHFVLDALRGGKPLPFRLGFWFRQGFCARKQRRGWGQFCERPVGGCYGWEGEEGGEEGLDAVSGSGL